MAYIKVETLEKLIEELTLCKVKRSKEILYCIIGIALMFINVFLTVFMTDEQDISEFSAFDTTVFCIMTAIEIVTTIITFYFANAAGKKNLLIAKLYYDIRRRIIETSPLLPGNVMKVFADADYTERVTMFGYPNSNSVYMTSEYFHSDYSLIKSFETRIYENSESIPLNFDDLIDISDNFIKKR